MLKNDNRPYDYMDYMDGSARPTIQAERLHRQQRLAGTFRLFARRHFDVGLAGHVTARDPEHLDCFWVNPLGRHFSQIRVSDLLLVDSDGVVVEGDAPLNLAAFAIHSAIHKARPDVISAAHTHSLYGRTWSTLGRLLDPLTQDSCAFFEDHGLFDDYTGVVFDVSEGERIAAALGNGKAVILRNHGFLTAGNSVEEAAWWFISMDNAARTQLMAEAVGKPRVLSDETARFTFGQIGSNAAGLRNFSSLWDQIVTEEPDLLE